MKRHYNYGYLGSAIDATAYARIAPATPWVVLVYPGPYTIIPAGATAAQIRPITDQHVEELQQYQEHLAVQTAFKKQVIAMLVPAYLEGYKEPIIQFGNQRIDGISWVWLYQQYGRLTSQDKAQNTKNFHKDLDPTLPFEAFAAKIDECVEIAKIQLRVFQEK